MVIKKFTLLILILISLLSIIIYCTICGYVIPLLALLVFLVTWHSLKYSLFNTYGFLKSTFPFLVTLILFGLIFHVIRLSGRSDWLADTVIKVLAYPNSVLAIKLILAYVSYTDIIQLPIETEKRISLITTKAVYDKGNTNLPRLRWHLSNYPVFKKEIEIGRKIDLIAYIIGRIKGKIAWIACLIVSLYLLLLEEEILIKSLINNRYTHLEGS